MKIAYFADTFTPEVNGVTNTLTKLSSYLEKREIEHAFFVPDYDGKRMIVQERHQDKKSIYRFGGFKVNIAPNSCLAFPRTREIFDLCDEFSPDLVHVISEFGIGFKGMKYATSRKLPLVMSYHTDYYKYLNYYNLNTLESILDLYLKWFHSFPQRTLVPSKFTLEQLNKKDYKNLGIWSRGIDTGKFNTGFRSDKVRESLGIGDKFAFLFVGRLSPEKGLHMLLHAIETINNRFPGKAVFVFTGDGPYAENIRQSGFDNVRMTGFQTGEELSKIYASCDCFAFPSSTETFGNAPLEAMASGLPVVGINSGGVTEFLIHGYNSLLCEKDNLDTFTDHLIEVMENKQLHSLLKINGLHSARSRDWDVVFDGLLDEYHEVMKERTQKSFGYVS